MFDFKVTTKYHETTGDWRDTLANSKGLADNESSFKAQVFFDDEGYYVWYEGFEALLTRFKV